MDDDRVTGAARKVAGKAEAAIGDFVGDGKTSAEGRATELRGKAESLVGQAKDAARDVADTASDYLDDAVERGKDFIQEGRRRLPDAAESYYRDGTSVVRGQVADNPLAALVVAGTVGYLLALLLHRR